MNRDRKLELALKHELRSAGTPDRDACVDPETLSAWADGGLDAVRMASVELHAATCARCQAILGATARSAPVAPVTEAPAGVSLWKWWLAPIAAGAAAVTFWIVVPQETMQAPPSTPAPVMEAKKDAPAEPQAKQSAPAADNQLADDSRQRATAIGAVAAPPPPPSPTAPPAPAASATEMTSQARVGASAPLELVSPDSRRRWRVIGASIERSEDSGATWIGVHQTSGDTITGGTAPAASICWLIGTNGVVLLTADGVSFARVPIPVRVALTGVSATGARSAIVTTADGRRFRTDDSGRSWREN